MRFEKKEIVEILSSISTIAKWNEVIENLKNCFLETDQMPLMKQICKAMNINNRNIILLCILEQPFIKLKQQTVYLFPLV